MGARGSSHRGGGGSIGATPLDYEDTPAYDATTDFNTGAAVVVRVGNTGGTGASWSETGNVVLAVKLFVVVRVEYAYLEVYIFLMVDVIGPFRRLLELYLGGPMREQRVVVSHNAEGIYFFKKQTLGRGALAFEAFVALDVLGVLVYKWPFVALDVLGVLVVYKWRGATLGLGTLRTTRVPPSEAGEFLEEVVRIILGVTLGDFSCI